VSAEALAKAEGSKTRLKAQATTVCDLEFIF